MRILEDRRPTLASWPKRIYDWRELPRRFQPGLEAWRAQGLPPGNVTYIPRISQYAAGGAEHATAWLGDQVLIQTGGQRGVEELRFCGADVAMVDYYVELLRCTVTISLGEERGGEGAVFSYNKTKEDQLLPILLLSLGREAGYRPAVDHPAAEPFQTLQRESYAMYNNSKLCYRFGTEIRDYIWFLGRNRGLARLNKQKPEHFLAQMDAGLVAIRTDFYGRRTSYIPWKRLGKAEVREEQGQAQLFLSAEDRPAVQWPLLGGQREQAEAFLAAL